MASAPLQGSAWFLLGTDGWGWEEQEHHPTHPELGLGSHCMEASEWPGPRLWCAGGLSGRKWDMSPFGAMISKSFSMGTELEEDQG